jgi:hypothetical protein
MTQEEVHQEASKQIEEIKLVFPKLQEYELKFIESCLRSAYIQGAIDALNNKNQPNHDTPNN